MMTLYTLEKACGSKSRLLISSLVFFNKLLFLINQYFYTIDLFSVYQNSRQNNMNDVCIHENYKYFTVLIVACQDVAAKAC